MTMTGIGAFVKDSASTVAKFLGSRTGEAFLEKARVEQAAATLEERRQIAAEIATLEAAEGAAFDQHARRLAPLTANIARLEAQLADAHAARRKVEVARRDESFTHSQRLDTLRANLRASAPRELVAVFIADLQKRLDDLRLQGDYVQTRGIDGHLHVVWSNNESREACSLAIVSAIHSARALANEALDDDELRARFEALRAAIPAVEQRPAKYYDGDAT